MRCKNCGWENAAGGMKCEKCNAPLCGSMIAEPEVRQSRPSQAEQSVVNLKGTIPEAQVFGGEVPQAAAPSACSKCGYPLARGMNACPNCGASAAGAASAPAPAAAEAPVGVAAAATCSKCGAQAPSGAKFCPVCGAPFRFGTVNPWMTPQSGTFCTLKPLAWENEQIDYSPLSFSGEVISLNRANTDPNNQTITSQVQAELTCENGVWYICDKSAQQTTYVHVGRKTKLETGDILILGNRRFEFKG